MKHILTNKNIMKKITIVFLFIGSLSVMAQEKENESKFSLSGSVDTYYSTNLTTSGLGTTGILSDVTANGFGLGMVNTIFSYESGKTGIVADLTYGPRANAANAYKGAINQLYVFYQASESLKITLGQFNTFFGYEVISPTGNFNYSVSYLFNAGPFSHTGVKLDFTASDDLSLMLAITNPHGVVEGANNTDDYQLGVQVGFKGQFFNGVYGADGFGFKDVLYLDYTGGFDLSDSFRVGINAAYSNSQDADAGYYGGALYLEGTLSDTFALGLRPELFTLTSAAGDSSVIAATLAGNITLSDHLKVITELRYDGSDDVTFVGGKDNVTGLTIAAIYSF